MSGRNMARVICFTKMEINLGTLGNLFTFSYDVSVNFQMHLSGHWEADKASGFGILEYSNGDVYEGEFRDCTMKGKGEFRFANGDIYRGKSCI
jgi:hypothetical protein